MPADKPLAAGDLPTVAGPPMQGAPSAAAHATESYTSTSQPVEPTMGMPGRAEPADDLRSFGDYVILQEIARGGMGVVYKARQERLNRLVAVKMIRAGQFADQEQVRRFQSEAAAAGRLD